MQLPTTSLNSRIGTMLDGGNRKFVGIMDEVQGWDFILSDTDVMTVYGQAVGLFGKETPSFPMNAYPNPATDQLNVEFSAKSGQPAEIVLMNAQGQTVSQESFTTQASNTRRLSVSNLATGVYMVKVSVDGLSSFQKVVVK
ncbi:MAG: T9SS type A sorting domain-containing protein [Bacteroidia bacterium]